MAVPADTTNWSDRPGWLDQKSPRLPYPSEYDPAPGRVRASFHPFLCGPMLPWRTNHQPPVPALAAKRSVGRALLAVVAAALVASSWVPLAAPQPAMAADPVAPLPRPPSDRGAQPGPRPAAGRSPPSARRNRVRGQHRHQRPDGSDRRAASRPTAGSSSPRRAAASASIRALPRRRRQLHRPRTQGQQLLGPGPARVRPSTELPNHPLCLRPLHPRRRDRRDGAALERCLPVAARPDDRRLRRQRPPVAIYRSTANVCGRRAGPDRGLLPAVPEPLGRRSRVRTRRRPVHRPRGDGASFTFADYGQAGSTSGGITPRNPCGDPPGGVGGAMTPPTARGGALQPEPAPPGRRSDRPRRHPAARRSPTGAGLPTNPLVGELRARTPAGSSPTACAIRSGSRSGPGRTKSGSATSAGTTWEEINRVVNPLASTVANLGWPCYEGSARQSGYEALNLAHVQLALRDPDRLLAPYYAYTHSAKVVAGESCPTGSSVISGITFYDARTTRPRTATACSSRTTRGTASGR